MAIARRGRGAIPLVRPFGHNTNRGSAQSVNGRRVESHMLKGVNQLMAKNYEKSNHYKDLAGFLVFHQPRKLRN